MQGAPLRGRRSTGSSAMGKELERDLGLYATLTISIGAMLGSGIFVLPGLATKMAGPAVMIAYVLAGLIALPAALSKAEMATALPEAGGTYLYIDRAMGPFMGTLSGIGVWFSLTFKSAFALVGLGAYLVLFAALPTKLVALALGAGLIALNIFGVKQTGTLQAAIVSGVLAVLMWFIATGSMSITVGSFDPIFKKGLGGLLGATGFVFVSYAGVTKIASVAEEVEDPGRNIPLGILGSIAIMMVVYALIVTVIVGVVEPGSISKSLTPMADAAGAFLGRTGVVVIAVTAVLALTGMANAGLLSSSRYPLAMSRDKLAPDGLQKISDKFRTPVAAISVTGTLLLLLIATIPVVELAKLASAFKILVFVFINVALIAMREGEAEWYEPSFRSPLYPWVQLVGIVGGIVLLTQMGVVPFVGAVGLILAGTAYYQFYARDRTKREGVGRDAIRRGARSIHLEEAETEISAQRPAEVLIAVEETIPDQRLKDLLQLAHDVRDGAETDIRILAFEEVPDQLSLDLAARDQTPEDIAFEERVGRIAEGREIDVTIGEVVSHDRRRALRNYVESHNIGLVVAEADDRGRNPIVSWTYDGEARSVNTILLRHGPGDSWPDLELVEVVTGRGPLDPTKVQMANAIAKSTGASIRFLLVAEDELAEQREASLYAYGDELADLCEVSTDTRIVRVDEDWTELPDAIKEASLVIGSRRTSGFSAGIENLSSDQIRQIDAPLLIVDSGDREAGFVRRIFERLAY